MSGFITNIFLCFLLFLCESVASDCDFLVYGNATRGEYNIYSEKNDPVYCVEDDAKPIQLDAGNIKKNAKNWTFKCTTKNKEKDENLPKIFLIEKNWSDSICPIFKGSEEFGKIEYNNTIDSVCYSVYATSSLNMVVTNTVYKELQNFRIQDLNMWITREVEFTNDLIFYSRYWNDSSSYFGISHYCTKGPSYYTFKSKSKNISCKKLDGSATIQLKDVSKTNCLYKIDFSNYSYICSSGSCGCKTGYNGTQCENDCADMNKWGENCSNNCNGNCSKCDRVDGHCTECMKNHTGNACEYLFKPELSFYKNKCIKWKKHGFSDLNFEMNGIAVRNYSKCIWQDFMCTCFNDDPSKLTLNRNVSGRIDNLYEGKLSDLRKSTDEPRNFNKKLSGKLVIFNWQHPDYIETDLTIFIILVTEITPGLEPINQNKTIVYEEKLNFTTEIELQLATEYTATIKGVYVSKIETKVSEITFFTEVPKPRILPIYTKTENGDFNYTIQNITRFSRAILVELTKNAQSQVSNISKYFTDSYESFDVHEIMTWNFRTESSTEVNITVSKEYVMDTTYLAIVVVTETINKLEFDKYILGLSEVSHNVTLIITISIISIATVVILIGVIIVLIRCPKKIEKIRKHINPQTVQYSSIEERNQNNTEMQTLLTIEKMDIPKDNLKNYLMKNFESLEDSYLKIPTEDLRCTYEIGRSNKIKNRYKNILPYDQNRVILENTGCDYINASYIDGYRVKNEYIATQGAKKDTVYDFLSMILQLKIDYIIMLTNIIENNKKKCEQYWPETDTLKIEEIHVSLGKVITEQNYTIRELLIVKSNQQQKVVQYHFHAWPDHDVINNVSDIIPFLNEIRRLPRGKSPIVVHCSAGVGRTGCLILIDYVITMAQNSKFINFINTLATLRSQRKDLVQSKVQFMFCHLAVFEYLTYKDFTIRPDKVAHLNFENVEGLNKRTTKLIFEYLKSFQDFDVLKHQCEPEVVAPANQEKNRNNEFTPRYERIYLQRYPFNDINTDYINAINVDCYKAPKRYIVTQQPLPNTLGDFWRMVDQINIDTIISLNEYGNNNNPQIWPEPDDVLKPVDYLKIRLNSSDDLQNIQMIQVNLSNKSKDTNKNIDIYHLKGWNPGKLTPNDYSGMVTIWDHVRNQRKLLIVCFDGCTASGPFLAYAVATEQINQEKLYNPVYAIRIIRTSRPEFIQNEEQITFVHKCIYKYFQSLNPYSNFV
ncbi:receptor-type tyrosine-protein phosphatase alpha [Aethina tumida]|uniref:receptor-type tyrosine-protein phosphatase alpha n=1 Tax=Aethina tumida TaxID=116153 RepID=UPI0021481EAE|nr:receptor-type tyrosine-protein phosphatase alpha [Aethina tumida]